MAPVGESSLSKPVMDLEFRRYKKWFKKQVEGGNYKISADGHTAGTLADENVWSIKAGAPITQSVLDDAFKRQAEVLDYFAQSGITASGRPSAKSWHEVKQDRQLGFSAYKDTIAIRVPYYKMSEAPILVTKVLELVKAIGGVQYVYYERDPDIVHFINWYHPDIGHTIHVQVIHMFAQLAFERDSLLKQSGAEVSPGIKHIDLWDEGLYINVRDALLDRQQWHDVWRESPEALWLCRLDKLILAKHQDRQCKEREEDEELKEKVDEALSRAFFGSEHDVASIVRPVKAGGDNSKHGSKHSPSGN